MRLSSMRQSSALKKTRECSLGIMTAFALLPVVLASCRDRFHEINESVGKDKVPVTICVNNMNGPGYAQTRALVDVGQVCSNLSFCIYPCEGESFDKIQINQLRDDESFGTVSQNLTLGVHKIVVIAHNGDKNATMTNPESISFTSNTLLKTTDTFCWAGEVNVTPSTGTVNVTLTRATAMFRFILTGTMIHDQVSELHFAYKGGSAAVNPFTLEGTVRSNQRESFVIEDNSRKVFEIYTFPRYEDSDNARIPLKLDITVTAIDINGNAVKERVLNDVPIERNRITECRGDFFAGGTLEYATIEFGGIKVEPDWAGTDQYSFPE